MVVQRVVPIAYTIDWAARLHGVNVYATCCASGYTTGCVTGLRNLKTALWNVGEHFCVSHAPGA